MSKNLPAALFFCYFKFYQDPNIINQILEKYCKEFTLQTSSGYNYREYKCYVLNVGGLDKAISEFGGYIKTERETGFIDASPTDSLTDQTIVMGLDRITGNDITLLNFLPEGTRIVFRRLVASDTGMAHKISFKFDDKQKILHPVCYTYDSTQVQIVEKKSIDIVDESNVDGEYEFSVDVDVIKKTATQYSTGSITITDEEKAFDSDYSSYAVYSKYNTSYTTVWVIYDFGEKISSLYVKGENLYSGIHVGSLRVQYSDNPSGGWINLVTTGYNAVEFSELITGIDARYVRIYLQTSYSTWYAMAYIHNLIGY